MAGLVQEDRIPATAALLGGAGVVPFAVAAAAQWLTVPHLPAHTAMTAGLVYAALVLSFLGGVRWGTALATFSARRQSIEFMLSMLPPLAALVALLLPHLLAVSLLIAGFLLQGQWDVMSVEKGRLPSWFGKLGMFLTASAVLSLIALLLRLLI